MKFVCAGILTGLLLGTGLTATAQDAAGTLELNPVVVTATRQEEKVLQVPSHVTVITQEDIRGTNATNAGDLLRTEAGLWVANTSGSAPSGMIIDGRGFNNGGGNGGRILVLVDGRRANLVDTSNPDWASIPVEAIDRIEIVRGPSASFYGDNSIAGVINIITKTGAKQAYTDLSYESGSYDFSKRKAALSETSGAFGYYLYGGYETSDGYRENSDYRASNYIGNLSYKISDFSTVHLRSAYISNDYLLPGSLTQDEIDTVGRRGSVTPLDHAGTNQGRIDLAFDSYLDRNQWMELTAGQTLRGEGSLTTIPNSGSTNLDDDSRSVALSGKYRITGPIAGGENRFLLGTDLLKEAIRAKSFNDYPDPNFPFITVENTDYGRRLIGAYASEELPILSALTLNATGRMDWSRFTFSQATTDLTASAMSEASGNRSFRVWSPTVGLTYLTSPSTSLFASWSRTFRFPNRDELTGLFGVTPELDPERATTYEAGEKIQAGSAFEGTLSLFRTDVKNEILFVPPAIGASAFGVNENVPEVRHEGIEASAAVRPSPTFRVRGSYAFTRTEIQQGPFDGSHLPITPRHAGSVTMDWGQDQGSILSVTGRFVGNRILANDLANQQEKLPAYSVLDAKYSYRADYGEVFFGINNFLNRKYDDFGGVGGFPFGSRIGFNPAPERNYIGGATIRF
ncbi:MAG TPA: TonB-dependent receptor [Nitrospiria bacterium]|nr:TonB-dependent receptor [Nitrospiria bacterium]HUK56475.1 TonB-dependent receptor [Nitrospiria bacterium]